MNIFDLLNPSKSTDNFNENFNNQPNNSQPNSPQPDNPQSENFQPNNVNQIKLNIEQKVKEKINDPILNKTSNMFNKTGKSSDFTAE